MSKSEDADKAVGYKKPPRNTRFKPGQSGNPKGRPKGVLSLAKTVHKALREKIMVVENGRRRPASKLDAAITQLVNKAVKGDTRSIQMLMALAPLLDETAGAAVVNSDMDHALMAGVLKRLTSRSHANANNEPAGDQS